MVEYFTFVFQMKASVRNRPVTAERQMHRIRAALYPLWEFAVLETTNERTVAVWTIVDVQEVIVWLNVEARDRRGKSQRGTRGKGATRVSKYMLCCCNCLSFMQS